ncbi:aspartate 1-decarboxylase [bacterium]|nr:aspartate 1-decarboxylase [bacterium]
MWREMMKSKIHRATVTDANLQYMGSITIDELLMNAADLRQYEKVQVVNINNGARLETYVIKGPAGKGDITLNGAAARLAHPGDKVIILSYVHIDEKELAGFEPHLVYVDDHNRMISK